jgi:SAM-dependent methyltransferase
MFDLEAKRGALRLSDSAGDLEALQVELDALDPTAWRPLAHGEGWSRIQLLEPDGRGGLIERPALRGCPTMRALAERFGARVMALTLARLAPGGGVAEHRDLSGGLSLGVVRLHVPLRTDPAVEFVVAGERVTMVEGEIWHLDTTYPHRVVNRSQRDRVHLILDLEAGASTRALLPEPDLRDYLHRAGFAAICVGKGLELAVCEPAAAVDRALRFVKLRVLGQAVLTFDDAPAQAEPAPEPTPEPTPEPSSALPERVPAMFACPECRSTQLERATDLRSRPRVPWAGAVGLRCRGCAREYPYVNGVWVLWSDELAELIAAGEPDLTAPAVGEGLDPRAVKQANYAVYERMSAAYGEHADDSVPYLEQLLLLKAHAGALLDRSPRPGHERALVDVGCAGGFALDVGSFGFTVRIGVDISLRNLEQVAAAGHLAVLADAERLPFAEASVDLVTCFAAMHHFPDAAGFMASAHACLRPDGVLLTSADPSRANMDMGPLARLAWDLRKPVYRRLARISDRFYLHADADTQALNDLAEVHRTGGGFDPDELRGLLGHAGFTDIEVFLGVDRSKSRRFGRPRWQEFVLGGLSGRNPLRRENFVSLTTLSRR